MARKTQAKTKPAGGAEGIICTTHRQLGAAVGVHHSTITRRLKRADCPISPTPPWDADDVLAMQEALSIGDDEGEGGDDLKRAQAVKAKVLAAKYLLEMATTLGRVGGDEAALLMKVLPSTTTLHFQATRFRLGDILRERGGIPAPEADREAEEFARWFYGEWATTFTRMLRFHTAANDSLTPMVNRISRLADELEILGDVDPSLVEAVRMELDAIGRGDESDEPSETGDGDEQ